MKMSNEMRKPQLIATQTASMLTGKTLRTIQRLVSDGEISSIHPDNEQAATGNVKKMVDIHEVAPYLPIPLTDELVTYALQADSGDPEGVNLIGIYYQKLKEYKIAFRWYETGAKKGHPDAMDNLSTCYFRGFGVDADFTLGMEWLSSAASRGHMIAKEKLKLVLISVAKQEGIRQANQ
jgi:TPR repeat protein